MSEAFGGGNGDNLWLAGYKLIIYFLMCFLIAVHTKEKNCHLYVVHSLSLLLEMYLPRHKVIIRQMLQKWMLTFAPHTQTVSIWFEWTRAY